MYNIYLCMYCFLDFSIVIVFFKLIGYYKIYVIARYVFFVLYLIKQLHKKN